MKGRNLSLLLFLLLFSCCIFPQDAFVKLKGESFVLAGSNFHFLGFNAYYLQSEASSDSRKYIVEDVFKAADTIGVKIIRTWAFYEDDDSLKSGVIRYAPYKYNESSLQALDYVLYKAKLYNIKLILTLSNNYPDFGGIKQYIKWANKYLKKNTKESFDRNDFFTNDSLKAWYKNYVSLILNRINVFTRVRYKDDPSIFSFELMNEAENEGCNSSIINDWYSEMSNHFKLIDKNHLLTTGEMGFDTTENFYSDLNLFYNSSQFLFNGSKGTSYFLNSSLSNIDYCTFHLYPRWWSFSVRAGETWIKDHLKIGSSFSKPALLAEFGNLANKEEVYSQWLRLVEYTNCRSAVVWQYLHPDISSSDGYGFNLSDTNLIAVFRRFIESINKPVAEKTIPVNVTLYQNYPNPFNPVTTIKYSIPDDEYVRLELYTVLGELVGILDSGFKKKGEYELVLSFNSFKYASGIFLYTLRTPKTVITKKLILLK